MVDIPTPAQRAEALEGARHTPGPWSWGGPAHALRLIADAEGRFVLYARHVASASMLDSSRVNHDATISVSEADRALIAAAPDLLEALAAIRATAETVLLGPDIRTFASALAAIAHAAARSLAHATGEAESLRSPTTVPRAVEGWPTDANGSAV